MNSQPRVTGALDVCNSFMDLVLLELFLLADVTQSHLGCTYRVHSVHWKLESDKLSP